MSELEPARPRRRLGLAPQKPSRAQTLTAIREKLAPLAQGEAVALFGLVDYDRLLKTTASLCPTCLDPPPGCYEGAWSGARAVGLTKPRLAKVKVDCEPQYVDVDVAGGTSYVKGLRDAGILWSRFDSDGGPGCWDPDCALDVGVKPICKANHACY